ncbi:MAG TPA: ATPase, T2SS/T4P/T4SS family, partial [Pseudomonadales bacterium]|nr:ATPase, T2SS/T4P/T4SS family [Pseudomonadales bacterium]
MVDWFSFRKSGKAKFRSATDVELGEMQLSEEERIEAERKRRELKQLEHQWSQYCYEQIADRYEMNNFVQYPVETAKDQITLLCNQVIDAQEAPLDEDSRFRVIQQVISEIIGLGPLDELFNDGSISDIMVNGAQQVYVERRGKLELSSVTFNDDAHLMRIIERIVSSVGRRIDEFSPMVDARLKDGSRVNVIIPPLALDGPSLSIRRFTVEKLDMHNLIEMGALNEAIAKVLEAVVKLRLNILISGGTGS